MFPGYHSTDYLPTCPQQLSCTLSCSGIGNVKSDGIFGTFVTNLDPLQYEYFKARKEGGTRKFDR